MGRCATNRLFRRLPQPWGSPSRLRGAKTLLEGKRKLPTVRNCMRGDLLFHFSSGLSFVPSRRPTDVRAHLARVHVWFLVQHNGPVSNAVKTVLKEAGFRRCKSGASCWNALWALAMKGEEFRDLAKFQKVNHFPGTWELGAFDGVCNAYDSSHEGRRP